jgi:hypothetical protein
MTLDSNGSRMATGGYDFDVKLWDFAGWHIFFPLPRHAESASYLLLKAWTRRYASFVLFSHVSGK